MSKVKREFFMIDNNIFNLKLDAYEFQIYCYLVCRAGKSGTCWPSYKTISRELGISVNTAIKKVDLLTNMRLIEKQGTVSANKFGNTRTGNNRYTILPFEEAWEKEFRVNQM